MTSFVAWIGVDSRGPASAYLASDSRVSWGSNKNWDAARKLYASRCYPDILGYVGDVLFPSIVLGQTVEMIDAGLLAEGENSADARFGRIVEFVQESFDRLPDSERRAFSIAYITRCGEGMGSSFFFGALEWSKKTGWDSCSIPIPDESSAIWVDGSGKDHVRLWQERWDGSSQGRTSRAVFSAFCDALRSRADAYSGGAPQLVGLYRQGAGRQFGIATGNGKYFSGARLLNVAWDESGPAEWRNELFERCGPDGERLLGVQSHHAPKGLGGGNGAGRKE